MAAEEVAYLQDQVQRLNAALGKYQQQFPRVQVSGEKVFEDSQSPWIVDRNLMAPLLTEYDGIILDLENRLVAYEGDYANMKEQIQVLICENEDLRKQLKDLVEQQLNSFPIETVETGEEQHMIDNFQHQLQHTLQEKDAAVKLWKDAVDQIEQLEKNLQALRNSQQWRVAESKAKQVEDQYYQSVTSLNAEIHPLQAHLRQSKSEVAELNIKRLELENLVDELRQQLKWKDQEMDSVVKRGVVCDSRLGDLQKAVDDLRNQLLVSGKELEQVRMEKLKLEKQVTLLQEKSMQLEHRELEAMQQVRDALQMVENVILEKDQAEVRTRQKEEQIIQLKEAINKLMNDVGLHTRKEVDNVRKQYNDRIAKLIEELKNSEMMNSEMRTQLERALREKRCVESEMEKLHSEGLVQSSREHDSYERTHQRAINAERACDEALRQIESLTNQRKREEKNHEQVKLQLMTQIGQLRERLSSLEALCEKSNDERLRLTNENDELKSRLQAAESDRDMACRKMEKEVAILKRDHNLKMREFEVKLHSTEDVNRQSMFEVRNLLTAQQRMTAKWKEECHAVSRKYEGKISEFRSEISHMKSRNGELTTLLRESKVKTKEVEQLLGEYTQNIRRMESRVRSAEDRARQALNQLSQQAARQRQLENENCYLHGEMNSGVVRSPRNQSSEEILSLENNMTLAAAGNLNNDIRTKVAAASSADR